MSTANIVDTVIRHRRSVKPAQMNGQKVPDHLVQHFLEMADWAPTHGLTEPWYYRVYSGDRVKSFCQDHADMYRQAIPAEKFAMATYEKLLHNGDKVSHILAAAMKRGDNPKIPELEEIAAVAASIQTILLTATAHGVASFWSTGGITHHQAMKQYLELDDRDIVMGLIYLGYTDNSFTDGKWIKPNSEKWIWE